jgi:hypothetical protein
MRCRRGRLLDITEDSWRTVPKSSSGRSEAVTLGAEGSVGEDAVQRRNLVSSVAIGKTKDCERYNTTARQSVVVEKELTINQFGSSSSLLGIDPKGVELVLA